MKKLFQYTVLGFLLVAGHFAYAQQSDGPPTRDTTDPPSVNTTEPPSRAEEVTPGDRALPSEQGSELTDDVEETADERSSGIFPEDNSPWFDNDELRRELDLDEDQIRRLNDAYGAAWRQMRTEGENAGRAGEGLSEEARARRVKELRDRFDDTFSRDSASVFRDEQQRRRFNQLALQRRGFSAFDDPRLQRELNLNDRQLRQLRDLNRNWNSELERLRNTYAASRTGTERAFDQLRDRSRTRFEGILNDQQQRAFDEMRGEPIEFGADTFLDSGNSQRPSAGAIEGSDIGTLQDTNPQGSGLGTPQDTQQHGSGLGTPQDTQQHGSGLATPTPQDGTGSGASN